MQPPNSCYSDSQVHHGSAERRKRAALPPQSAQRDLGCCASMIMSPFVLDRNVALIGPPKGGQIGADRNEQGGVRKSGSAGAGAEQAAARGGCGATDACELPAGEAVVEALSGGRGHGTEARQRGAIVESRSRCEVQKEGAAAGTGEVRWAGGRAFRTDAGGGTLGVRG